MEGKILEDGSLSSPAESDDVKVFEEKHFRSSFFKSDPRFVQKSETKMVDKIKDSDEPEQKVASNTESSNKQFRNSIIGLNSWQTPMDKFAFGDMDLKKYFGSVDPRASFLAGVAPLHTMSADDIMREHGKLTVKKLSPMEPSPMVDSHNATPVDTDQNHKELKGARESKNLLSSEVTSLMMAMEQELASDAEPVPVPYESSPVYANQSNVHQEDFQGSDNYQRSLNPPDGPSSRAVYAAEVPPPSTRIDAVGMSGQRTAFSMIMDADGNPLRPNARMRAAAQDANRNLGLQTENTAVGLSQPQQSTSILLSCYLNKLNRHGGFQKRLFRLDGTSLMCFSKTAFDLPEGHNIVSTDTKLILKLLHSFVDKPTKLAIGKCYLRDLPSARYVFNPMLAECSTNSNPNPNIRGMQIFLPKYVIPLGSICSLKFPSSSDKRSKRLTIVISTAKQSYTIKAPDQTWLLKLKFILSRIALVLRAEINNKDDNVNLLLDRYPIPQISESLTTRQALSQCWKESMEALIESDGSVKSHIVTIKSIRPNASGERSGGQDASK